MGRFWRGTLVLAALAAVASVQLAEAAPRPQSALRIAPSPRPAHRTALPGTALPQVSGAVRIGPSQADQVSAVVFLRPQNAALLHRIASRTSARTPYSRALLEKLFLPPAGQIAAVEGYLRSQGLTITARHLLSIDTTGSVQANQRAFGVSLGVYRGANGRLFRAPSGAIKLPSAIASTVQTVGGLDTALRLHPQTSGATAPATAPTACSQAQHVQDVFPGTLLPVDFASAGGYNSNPIGTTGNGQTIGLVEFSNYKHSDITNARNCFTLGSSPAVQDVFPDSPTSDLSGAGEVELDIQVAQETAPGATIQVYMTQNDVSKTVDIINAMVANGVNVASDSWGLCEPVLPPSLVTAENTSLELAAASGMSFYVASGDDGSSGCKRVTGSNALFVDDPSSQPFATSVGGTKLAVSPHKENAWKFGGGGVSIFWPKPQWQVGRTITVPNGGKVCGYPSQQCRQSPDIALDANPETGYIIFCTAGQIKCGGATGWYAIGGTSGAAPLMAGMTALANQYSGSHGGQDLGFASPFLYDPANASALRDVTSGNNNIFGGKSYPAGPGYDMATGLGSINAANLATRLAAVSQFSPSLDTTTITRSTPSNPKSISYGQSVTFSGALKDSTLAPIPNTAVWIQTSLGWVRAVTNSNGVWSVTLAKVLKRNFSWNAVFMGSDTRAAAATSTAHVYVRPHLSSIVDLPFSNGHYVARVGRAFVFHGDSTPNMVGARVVVQFRVGSSAWTSLGSAGVGSAGKYSVRLTDNRRETVAIRWIFNGGTSHHWLSAVSKARLVKVT
ncbi:MAG: S53 family peptidase [Gaiellales bacterium]